MLLLAAGNACRGRATLQRLLSINDTSRRTSSEMHMRMCLTAALPIAICCCIQHLRPQQGCRAMRNERKSEQPWLTPAQATAIANAIAAGIQHAKSSHPEL